SVEQPVGAELKVRRTLRVRATEAR
ncbi:MAG: hypothetical protein QOG63_960, partial [Thermoleophilaceae bacterium]|nr:hypothetical protein [Thermoleophilaceae bacterium]